MCAVGRRRKREDGGCRLQVNRASCHLGCRLALDDWITHSLLLLLLLHSFIPPLPPPPPITPSPQAFLLSVRINPCRGLSSDHATVTVTTTPLNGQVGTAMSPVGSRGTTLNASLKVFMSGTANR